MEKLKYTEILQLNKSLAENKFSNVYEIGILSNVIVNSYKEVLEYKLRLNDVEPRIEIGNFDNIIQDSAGFVSKNLVLVFYDTLNIIDNVSGFFEEISNEQLNELKLKLTTELDIVFSNLRNCPCVVFNLFSAAYYPSVFTDFLKVEELVNELNNYLIKYKPSNFILADINKIYISEGIKNCIDIRFYISSKAPYTFTFFKNYVQSLENVLLKNIGKLKKAIIFDCDNTLWKGVVGEDGMKGIDMSSNSNFGKYFNIVQHFAVYLSTKGVIIGICSKNNEQDVLDVLNNHKDMILKEEHIVIKKINWVDKATNLREIALELNIGLDSLVFIDDSSFEINLIKEQLPEVLTIQVPTKASEYLDTISKVVYSKFNLTPTDDDVKKTEIYKQQFDREKSKNTYASIDDYLASLQIELKIDKDNLSNIQRLSQLTQKTNQFNLTTIRYTENQITQLVNSEKSYVYAVFVKDKFGDSGLTGLCIVKQDYKEKLNVNIDTFLMSCRIIGRNIEYAIIDVIIKNMVQMGYTKISASYIRSDKNIQADSFYESIGFDLIKHEDGIKNYTLNIDENYINRNSFINVIKEFD